MSTEVKQQKTNYEIFIDTVNSLKNSQGFYSRLAIRLNEMSDEEKEDVKNQLNSLTQWNDTLDWKDNNE